MGGTVETIGTPLADGGELLIVRHLDIVQETDYVENDPFPAETAENSLDRLTMICLQLQEQIDRGLHQVWKAFPQVQLLNQVHDSILFQVPRSEADELVPQILEVMQVELELKGGRKFIVPLDAAGGWNWGYKSEDNPYGLTAWKGKEERVTPTYRARKKRQSLRDHLK